MAEQRKNLGLAGAVTRAVEQMDWVKEGGPDGAVVALAKRYALLIDEGLNSGDEYLATKRAYLGPHLLRTMESLGGSPLGRKMLEESTAEDADNPLAAMRKKRGA
ncbi:MAG: hypothetical protein Q4G40_12850 [Brachybacterium sp.]|nr:hypothetical protein [Brachybacterium sp.]